MKPQNGRLKTVFIHALTFKGSLSSTSS